MPRISRSALLPYSAAQIFALVDDFAAYPAYMKGCIAAEELQRSDQQVKGKLTLGKAGLRYSFTTCNSLQPPIRISMSLVEGPFRKFGAEWTFTPLSADACKVSYEMEFEMAAGIVDAALGKMFESTASEMVDAVAARARKIYSNQ